jgi:hypothetical protein
MIKEINYASVDELESAKRFIDSSLTVIPSNDIETLCKGYVAFDEHHTTYHRAPIFSDNNFEKLKQISYDSYKIFLSTLDKISQDSNNHILPADNHEKSLHGYAVHPAREMHLIKFELIKN